MQCPGDLVIYTSKSFEHFTTVDTAAAAKKRASTLVIRIFTLSPTRKDPKETV